MQTVELARLALAFVPVLGVMAIFFLWQLDYRKVIYAVARMLLQLLVVGYLLAYIFATDLPAVVLLVMSVMVLVSGWIALDPVSVHRRRLYGLALLSIALAGGTILLIVTQGVLAIDPWYSPQYLVPLGGMVFSGSMNAVSLSAERLFAERRHTEDYRQLRSVAFNAALIPVVNSLLAVGLVSLPGMMTGQILSGVSPLIAAKYQIVVMAMFFGTGGLAAAIYLQLESRRAT